jgi:anti-sigma factor RsiW
MNHKKMQVLVSSYVDHEVNDSEKAEAISHLEVCPACRQFVDHAKGIRENIRSLGEGALSSSFAVRVAYAAEKRDEKTVEWLGIEPSARNTFIVLAGFVLVLFFLTGFHNSTASSVYDQVFIGGTTNSVSTHILFQQENLSKNDLLYAVMTK